ncbi:hypothetical protein VF14_24555 [Nostoc linckia z18]|uniref:Uncharacterized protein n=2 Tax=Nostoc linckia TaxID=92942 RepID=A0A9Q5Z7L5_NOSLI|nr:hypothetical protein [Nostoc linckia]PHK27728.1 hypothetical protein VF12_34280 [Nostoc linckia z15]PHK43376.1 hypothetical protein VF13_27385 [Nostoc linckia z16]PHJ57380.1 hypothetical protein VF02_30280 [Nostoc linckia z1]PHJ59994.1 hypothetical protein VF05_31085 [Nostoc linckia z3]PHJ64856.1 hypothetical protein VF03_28330 [Nostoc linckia z2]
MSRNLQLGIESNWVLQYSISIPAVRYLNDSSGNPIYEKITEIIVPVVFDKPIIAVSVNTAIPVGKIWKYAGYLRRSLTTGLGASFVGDPEQLFLGKFNLIILNDLSIDYFVSIQVPKWFISATIAIYQYEGIDSTTLEDDVQAIKTSLGI